MHVLPDVDRVIELLATQHYVADRRLATAVFLALKLNRPLLLEGEAGVGKTELAKALSAALATPLIRLQCYEGLDVAQAAYEWNVQRQMLEIRLAEAVHETDRSRVAQSLYRREMLIERPLLAALTQPRSPVLLIDELDRADEPFEAFLLETLAERQITIPEFGTIRAEHAPIVLLTSNRTREIHDALRELCPCWPRRRRQPNLRPSPNSSATNCSSSSPKNSKISSNSSSSIGHQRQPTESAAAVLRGTWPRSWRSRLAALWARAVSCPRACR